LLWGLTGEPAPEDEAEAEEAAVLTDPPLALMATALPLLVSAFLLSVVEVTLLPAPVFVFVLLAMMLLLCGVL
jgi:hypothetical protein